MGTCFVIMPVTTPEQFLPIYNNDGAHFQHVLEHLIRPALEQLDFEVIPPTAAGADLIQAQIIENLETADLVLCDMSTLNPNVFFELGIRTALNKPVCMLRDNATPAVPFDTAIINFHTYLSELAPWTLEAQVQQLNQHIKDSIDRSNGHNALWRYFGLTTFASPPAQETGTDAKLDLLSFQVEALGRRLENPSLPRYQRLRQRSLSKPSSSTPPHVFIGQAFMQDLPAPRGTPLAAYIGRDLQGETTTTDDLGSYTLLVNGSEGATIAFIVGDRFAQETAVWESGGGTVQNLTAF